MVEYPVEFSAESQAESGKQGWTVKTDEGLETRITTPEEFGGDSDDPSPEDLFTASLTTCMVATFKWTAERKDLAYSEIKTTCDAELERGNEGRPFMKEATVEMTVTGIEDDELAEEIKEITEKNCFIRNSIETEVETEFRFP